MNGRSRAHGARLNCGKQFAVAKAMVAEVSSRLAQGHDFSMSGGSQSVRLRFHPRPTTRPAHTTTAPTGTSSASSARWAQRRASSIQSSSIQSSSIQSSSEGVSGRLPVASCQKTSSQFPVPSSPMRVWAWRLPVHSSGSRRRRGKPRLYASLHWDHTGLFPSVLSYAGYGNHRDLAKSIFGGPDPGLNVTFRYQDPKEIYTEQYPLERPQVAERYRGAPRLNVKPRYRRDSLHFLRPVRSGLSGTPDRGHQRAQ